MNDSIIDVDPHEGHIMIDGCFEYKDNTEWDEDKLYCLTCREVVS